VLEMEAWWPSGVALRGEASNHRMLRWLKTVVVSDPEKAGLDPVRWGPGRRSRSVRWGRPGGRALLRRRELKRGWHRKRGVWLFSRDEPGGCPDYWPGGARREGGVSLVCGSGTEREKASVDMAAGVAGPLGRERERAEAENRRH
jgi:hypothetical protein